MNTRLNANQHILYRAVVLVLFIALLAVTSSRLRADTGSCGGQTITLPFTDVMGNSFFCFIAQIYFQGITLGTSSNTYSPSNNVRRDQMAAFLARTQNSALNRGSRRAALNQFWTLRPLYNTPQGAGTLGTTTVGSAPNLVASDGADLWVANFTSGSVSQVHGSDGKLLGTWTGAPGAYGVLVALGRVFVTGRINPGNLYVIDPSQPAGAVTTLSNGLGVLPKGIAFDGRRIWTANDGSVSIITPDFPSFMVTNVGGFGDLEGILYDGANIWVTEAGPPGQLKKLDSSGTVVDTAAVGSFPRHLIYDGTNIWVPNHDSDSVSVVRATDGEVLATLTGNGLFSPHSAAFDGQRILITHNMTAGSVSLFRATDFAPLGSFLTGVNTLPRGACSDGLHFWIALSQSNKLARF
jgi:hypothetical protein